MILIKYQCFEKFKHLLEIRLLPNELDVISVNLKLRNNEFKEKAEHI